MTVDNPNDAPLVEPSSQGENPWIPSTIQLADTPSELARLMPSLADAGLIEVEPPVSSYREQEARQARIEDRGDSALEDQGHVSIYSARTYDPQPSRQPKPKVHSYELPRQGRSNRPEFEHTEPTSQRKAANFINNAIIQARLNRDLQARLGQARETVRLESSSGRKQGVPNERVDDAIYAAGREVLERARSTQTGSVETERTPEERKYLNLFGRLINSEAVEIPIGDTEEIPDDALNAIDPHNISKTLKSSVKDDDYTISGESFSKRQHRKILRSPQAYVDGMSATIRKGKQAKGEETPEEIEANIQEDVVASLGARIRDMKALLAELEGAKAGTTALAALIDTPELPDSGYSQLKEDAVLELIKSHIGIYGDIVEAAAVRAGWSDQNQKLAARVANIVLLDGSQAQKFDTWRRSIPLVIEYVDKRRPIINDRIRRAQELLDFTTAQQIARV